MKREATTLSEFSRTNIEESEQDIDQEEVVIDDSMDEDTFEEDSNEDSSELLETKKLVLKLQSDLESMKSKSQYETEHDDLNKKLIECYSDYEESQLSNDSHMAISSLENIISVVLAKHERNQKAHKDKSDKEIVSKVQQMAPEYGINSKFTAKFNDTAKKLLNNPKYISSSIDDQIKWVATEVKSEMRSGNKVPSSNSSGTSKDSTASEEAIKAVMKATFNSLSRDQVIDYLKKNPQQLRKLK
jgi:hypothetical protein